MANKKSVLGTLAALGGLAAATAVAYYKRNEIRGLLNDLSNRYFPSEQEAEVDVEVFTETEEENDIVIDTTAQTEEGEDIVEGTTED